MSAPSSLHQRLHHTSRHSSSSSTLPVHFCRRECLAAALQQSVVATTTVAALASPNESHCIIMPLTHVLPPMARCVELLLRPNLPKAIYIDHKRFDTVQKLKRQFDMIEEKTIPKFGVGEVTIVAMTPQGSEVIWHKLIKTDGYYLDVKIGPSFEYNSYTESRYGTTALFWNGKRIFSESWSIAWEAGGYSTEGEESEAAQLYLAMAKLEGVTVKEFRSTFTVTGAGVE